MTNGFAMTVAVAGVLALPALAAGQEPSPLPGSVDVQGASAAPTAENRRSAISAMEAVLSRAVLTGAENLATQLSNGNPNVSFFTGQARARGFVLDGYGVFFSVEIPEMQQSVVFSVTTLERNMALASALEPLERLVATAADGPTKIQAEEAIKRIQLQVGPPPPGSMPPRGLVRSADASPDAPPTLGAPMSGPPAVPVDDRRRSSPLPGLLLRDPNAAYREAIKASLIDAMLDYSRGLNLRPDEWLSVAARRGDNPLSPNEIVTSKTLVLRIKGADLALYDQDRSRKDEIRRRVDVKEF